MKILVTGTAGFIGMHLVEKLSADNVIVGIDNINDYYDRRLKYGRLNRCGIHWEGEAPGWGVAIKSDTLPDYTFIRMDITDREGLRILCEKERFDVIVNLAAQAGVRYSLENPEAYIESNVSGFINLLECARRWPVKHFVYASSSSVYGGNTDTPFAEIDRVDDPVSLYAATKRADELFAHVYARLYKIPCTGLRFFTVYGEWGRPDMSPMLFGTAMMEGRAIKVFNHGDMSRDFTYVGDIVEGLARVVEQPRPEGERLDRVYNIGHGSPVNLMDFIAEVARAVGVEPKMDMLPMQPGDVAITWADTTALERDYGYRATTPLSSGITAFMRWFKEWRIMD